MAEPVRFQLKRDYIVESLRAAIASGEYPPGQKLRQEELAARFGISSTPIREALRQLEAEGLVTSVAHQGVCVTRLSPEAIKERFRLRALLEAYATREAVTYLQTDLARRKQVITDLQAFQGQIIAAFETGQRGQMVELNYALHARLYEEARSPLLSQMISDLWKYQFPFSSLWLVPGRAEKAQAEHVALFEAIAQGDADTAEQLTREHIDLSSQMLLEHFEALPDKS